MLPAKSPLPGRQFGPGPNVGKAPQGPASKVSRQARSERKAAAAKVVGTKGA